MSPSTTAQLEKLGPVAVAKLLAEHEYGVPGSELRTNVEAWLHAKELEAELRREAREEESISIARMALTTSRSARTIAIIAIILTTIIAAVQAKDQILWVISKFGS